jgi:hypothetical protein
MRLSDAPSETRSTVVVECPHQKPADAILCGQEIERKKNCGACALCWESEKRIAFLQHGATRRLTRLIARRIKDGHTSRARIGTVSPCVSAMRRFRSTLPQRSESSTLIRCRPTRSCARSRRAERKVVQRASSAAELAPRCSSPTLTAILEPLYARQLRRAPTQRKVRT